MGASTLHVGHIYSLQEASKLGDELWVALNSDCSIKNLKGPNRPIYTEKHVPLCYLLFRVWIWYFCSMELIFPKKAKTHST